MLGLNTAFAHRDTRPDTRLMAEPGPRAGQGHGMGRNPVTVADYTTEGLLAGTRIATTLGWRPVDCIAVGDTVLTFDHGVQTVVAVTRAVMPDQLPAFARPILVPVGALGNETRLILLPDQSVMVESDAAEALFGDPFAILKARDLVGLRGIERVDAGPLPDVVTLHFAQHEVLHADGGALVVANADVPGAIPLDRLPVTRQPAPYASYVGRAAQCLVSAMATDDACQGEEGRLRPAA